VKGQVPVSHEKDVSPIGDSRGTCESLQLHGRFVVIPARVIKVIEGSQACGKADFLPGPEIRDMIVYGHKNIFTERHGLAIYKKSVGLDLEFCHIIHDFRRLKDGPLNRAFFIIECLGQKLRRVVLQYVKDDAG